MKTAIVIKMKNFFIYCRFSGYSINKNNFYSKYRKKNTLINFSLTNLKQPNKKGSALIKKLNLNRKSIFLVFKI
ncbi:hypothetical protein BXU01_17760 [[Flexibacter] sp. ATCC 35103]|nr:hypothetical protein BXU01_17760 [[Flexibacter] sp. ATCC 35103]